MTLPRNRPILIQLVGLLFLLTALVACGSPDPTPTLLLPPTLASTAVPLPTEPPVEPTTPPDPELEPEVTDQSWATIASAGTIRVGTSADYPPFSFYNSAYQIDGFDPALMQAIGAELGIEVELVDYTFDGLYDELALGNIDAIISAVSVTPDRQELVNFSNVYYVGEEGLLVAEDSAITQINSPADLVTRRVGVQNGSVYQAWLNQTLVDPGLMSPGLISSYSSVSQALDDLEAGRLEVVVMDALPADTAVLERGLRKVGGGNYPQLFAIVLPQGADSLTSQINAALANLNRRGVISELADEFLDLAELNLPEEEPTPASSPPPVASTTPTACVDSMSFVSDLTYDDQNMNNPPLLSPGQAFTKGWRVRNTGSCTWTLGYRLIFVQGNAPYARMAGQPISVNQEVPPNNTYDFQANLVAPLVPGTYQGFWQIINAANVPFGQRVWVGITVPSPATPTPMPTQTPTTDITFTANPTSLRAGERVVFSWSVRNARAVYFYEQGQNWENHGVVGQASAERFPQQTTTFELRVVRLDGSVEVRQIRIDVTPVLNAPYIDRLAVEPRNNVVVGQCVTVSWAVSGNVSNIRVLANDDVLRDQAPLSGNASHCPSRPGSYNYVIEATGPGGTNRTNIAIVVNNAVAPVPTATAGPPTPLPQPPIINFFLVDPDEVSVGECLTISWEASGGANRVQLLRNGLIVLDNAPLRQSTQDCPTEAVPVTYRLEVRNAAGQVVWREEVVQVYATAMPLPAQP